MPRTINAVLIYGYGVMGQGVARTFAEAGIRTIVKTSQAVAPSDVPTGVEVVAELPAAAPDLLIEFVSEDVPAKRAVFREIEAAYPTQDFILASGTSGLDLVELARYLKRPERFIGLHYFMPADKTPLVEVMAGPRSPQAVVDDVAHVLERTGKETVLLYQPIVGFLVNRLQHAILHEAYYLIEAGVASAADIDHAARRMLAPRMCLNGLIQQKDISGLKIHADAQNSIVPELFHNRRPNPMLQGMVDQGATGLASGKGFYDWEGCDIEMVRKQASARLAKLYAFLDDELPKPAPGTQPRLHDPRED
jgi:3-hydroxybutyryl-CoA dehydrogenase